MALCSSIVSVVNSAILIILIANLHGEHYTYASPSPLFFDAIANFFRPNRQTSGSSSSYGAPKPNYNRPNNVGGGNGFKLPGFNLPSFGGKRPSGSGGGGNGFKLPSFNLPSFGGKRPSGSASYGPPKKPSYRPPGNVSPGRPPVSIIPTIFNTSPTRPSYKPQPGPSRPRPVYRPPQRPNVRPTYRPNPRPTQGRPIRPGGLPQYGQPQRPIRPTNTRPTQPAPGLPQPHCNACSGPWKSLTAPTQQNNNNNVLPTYFPTFPNNGQTSSTGNPIRNNNGNSFRRPQYGQSSTVTNSNVNPTLNSYGSSNSFNNNRQPSSSVISSNNNNKFPKNMGVLDSTSSLDSYGSPQAPVLDNTSSLGSSGQQTPVINNSPLDNYGSSNNNKTKSVGQGNNNDNKNNEEEDIDSEYDEPRSLEEDIEVLPAGKFIGGSENDQNFEPQIKYQPNGKVVAELSVESPTLTLTGDSEDNELPNLGTAIDGSGEEEEVRSGGGRFETDTKSEPMFGDEWIPISLKKAMAHVLGDINENEIKNVKKSRNPKTLESNRKKILLMDALIDLAREMAKKKAKERSMAKMMGKRKPKFKSSSSKDRNDLERDLQETLTPPPPSPPTITPLPEILRKGKKEHENMKHNNPAPDKEMEHPDYDDTIWHVNPFRSEQDPVTIRTLPRVTTPTPTPTTIRFPLEEFLEDTISNPLVDEGLLDDNNEDDEYDLEIDTTPHEMNDKERDLIGPESNSDEMDSSKTTPPLTTQRPRSPKSLNINEDSFDRGLSTLATLATLTDAELNEEFNLVGHEGISTEKPSERLKEVRTIIVRRDKGGNLNELSNSITSPIITPLPDIFRLKERGKGNFDASTISTPSPISILGGNDFKAFTVQPTQSTLRTIKFTPTTAVPFRQQTFKNSLIKIDEVMRTGKNALEDNPSTKPTWVWQTKAMDDHGNEVITNTEKVDHANIIQKLKGTSGNGIGKTMKPTIQLTEDDFVILDDSWFNEKRKFSEHLKRPDVLTLPSEPLPTSSNLDFDEDDPRSSPSPDEVSKRVDKDVHAQPLELINPFMLGNPTLTVAPPTISSIAFPQEPSNGNNLFSPHQIFSDGDTSSPIKSRNKPYSLEENVHSKNWVLLSSPYNGNYDYEFDSIDAIETYDDYYNNEYGTENEVNDGNRKIETDDSDYVEVLRQKKFDEKKRKLKKNNGLKDSFRPSIKLSSILPSSNSFLPSRSNGALFKEFINKQKKLNKDFKQSRFSSPIIKGGRTTSVDGDHRLTSFNSFPLRTNARTLQQLISESPWSSKSFPNPDDNNTRLGKSFQQDEVRIRNNRRQKVSAKNRRARKKLIAASGKKSNKESVFEASRSLDDLSSKQFANNQDSDNLMIFYPLRGKPFLSFPPSKSFSTIAKRQIY